MLPDCPSPCPLMVKGTSPLLWASAETVCHSFMSVTCSMTVSWASMAVLWSYHPQLTGSFLPSSSRRGVSRGS